MVEVIANALQDLQPDGLIAVRWIFTIPTGRRSGARLGVDPVKDGRDHAKPWKAQLLSELRAQVPIAGQHRRSVPSKWRMTLFLFIGTHVWPVHNLGYFAL